VVTSSKYFKTELDFLMKKALKLWASKRFFPGGGGATRGFLKIFLGVAKCGKICFFPIQT